MTYKTLLFDVDDTLLDFQAAEKMAITELMKQQEVEPTEALIERYATVNRMCWQEYEQGLLSKQELLAKRFKVFFEELDRPVDGAKADILFRSFLEQGHALVDGATTLLDELTSSYDLYVVTNGVSKTQRTRMDASGIRPYFKEVFISEETGYQKPMPEFFQYVFNRIEPFEKNQTLIIGDSLTSDITGGSLAGIDTVWFNPRKTENPLSIHPTYEIHSLDQLLAILS